MLIRVLPPLAALTPNTTAHPFAPFTVHSAREGFALRLAASPLRPPLFAGLLCRHGDAGTENMLTVEDL